MIRTALFFLLPAFGALPAGAQSMPAYAIPNSKHYRESGVGNATGRTGSAQMTVRALLGSDGDTTIEVTTGVLDSSSTPPGAFQKVQLKPLNPDGDAIFAQNFTNIPTHRGYFSFNWPSLYRHQQTQIQSNITGIDNRTDVVTVVETVKLRPDLAIRKLNLPDSPLVNTPVIINANILELNGDSSATTSCQLFIDGALADKANNVYVDAAGAVSCAFSHTFTSTGNHTVQVTAANVMPADWDTGNNSASGTINIIDLNTNTAEHGTATFSDQKGGFPLRHTTTMQTWRNGGMVFSYSNTSSTMGEEQDANWSFQSSGCTGETNAASYQFPVDLTYAETMDGASVYTAKIAGITSKTASFPANQIFCDATAVNLTQQVGNVIADDYTFVVISRTYYDGSSQPVSTMQQVNGTRNGGDVTYLSSTYQCDLLSDCDNPINYHVSNSNDETVVGKLVPLGNTWVPSVSVRDAGGNGFGGSLAVSLSSNQMKSGQPNTCTNRGPDTFGYTYQNCSSSATDYTETQGSVSY
jgi:hypothetical protein